MHKVVQDICRDVINKYKRKKNVVGVMLFGSAVGDKFDLYSDIDIFVLVNKKIRYRRHNYLKNHRRVDIILNTIEEVKRYLQDEKYNVRRNTAHMLAHGQILYQIDDNFTKLQSLARNILKSTTRYSNNDILMTKYSMADYWAKVQRDICNNDNVASDLDSNLLMNNVIEFSLKLNGAYFCQSREMMRVLSATDEMLAQKIWKYYQSNSTKSKQAVLVDIMQYTDKKLNASMSKSWTILND